MKSLFLLALVCLSCSREDPPIVDPYAGIQTTGLLWLGNDTNGEPIMVTNRLLVANKQFVSGKPLPSLADDFVMGSPTAVSNAIFHSEPPDNFSIVCDSKGHYAPAHFGYPLTGNCYWNIRTNRFEALVATWRMKEILDTPRQQTTKEELKEMTQWHDCEEKGNQ